MLNVCRRLSFSFLILLSSLVSADTLDGEKIYSHLCSACHGFSGNGRVGLAPALRGSNTVKGDVAALMNVVMNGRSNTLMVAFKKNMSDAELAAVMSFVRESFGLIKQPVSIADVALARKK